MRVNSLKNMHLNIFSNRLLTKVNCLGRKQGEIELLLKLSYQRQKDWQLKNINDLAISPYNVLICQIQVLAIVG